MPLASPLQELDLSIQLDASSSHEYDRLERSYVLSVAQMIYPDMDKEILAGALSYEPIPGMRRIYYIDEEPLLIAQMLMKANHQVLHIKRPYHP